MTREKAIEILKDGELNPCVTEDREACDMAIKALEQQPCEDAISRKAVIDAIMGEPTDAHYPNWYAERLEQLPSAQPEPFFKFTR